VDPKREELGLKLEKKDVKKKRPFTASEDLALKVGFDQVSARLDFFLSSVVGQARGRTIQQKARRSIHRTHSRLLAVRGSGGSRVGWMELTWISYLLFLSFTARSSLGQNLQGLDLPGKEEHRAPRSIQECEFSFGLFD